MNGPDIFEAALNTVLQFRQLNEAIFPHLGEFVRQMDLFYQFIKFLHLLIINCFGHLKAENYEKCLFSNTQEFLHNIFITSFK